MIIFPAIDINENKCVRLSQGDFNKVNVYSNSPLDMAKTWRNKGAEFLHIVDLDGAKSEDIINKESIETIVKNIDIPIQIGGGIRSKEKIKNLLDLGVNRVILGTMAIENKELLEELAKEYKNKVIVSIDAKNGKVALRGWKVVSEIDSIDLCKYLESIGIHTIVYTDISKDGMLEGPNFDIYKELMEKTSLNIIASGGVSSVEDLKKLQEMNMYGAIIGKALYDNRISLEEVLECLREE
ncbi:1-(5-phosphoribosyl)-5-[(5-phosphoribosylamino)methylideneamino]imidazole-4-carboxamide isomerase [Romboutsia sp.]|uniref:1-(5-phosphoribosyl)-5-[(5- phosphoribosylamino)methylideneamino]imidazole-4- carboxamide isomerase n=1 Tax=Romboutsia sp. TaxID=1965302 RepID=UPI003F2D4A80